MLDRLVRLCDRAIDALAVIVLLAMLVVVMLGVITRAYDDPLIWTDELSRYLLVWTAALGWVIASRKRVHIRITFFADMLPKGARHGLEVLLQGMVALFGLMLIWQGAELVERNHDLEATSMPISVAWLYWPLILIGVFVSLQALAEAAQAMAGRMRVPEIVTEVIE